MSPEDGSITEQPDDYSSDDDLPVVEDAYAAEPVADETVTDDAPEFLAPAAPALEEVAEPEEPADDVPGLPRTGIGPSVVADDTSDVGAIEAGLPRPADTAESGEAAPWADELSTHKIVVELKRIEAEVRSLIEVRDSKRKRKLGGTRRWYDLEEDLIAWRYTGRFDEPTLIRLRDLITKRHYLFRRLHFLAGTRPTWNT